MCTELTKKKVFEQLTLPVVFLLPARSVDLWMRMNGLHRRKWHEVVIQSLGFGAYYFTVPICTPPIPWTPIRPTCVEFRHWLLSLPLLKLLDLLVRQLGLEKLCISIELEHLAHEIEFFIPSHVFRCLFSVFFAVLLRLHSGHRQPTVFRQQLSTRDLKWLFRLLMLVLFLIWGSFFNFKVNIGFR